MLYWRKGLLSLILSAFLFASPQARADCPALKEIETYQDRKSADYAYIIAPYNGWLFRTRGDLKQDFSVTPETISSLKYLHAALRKNNIQLVMLPIPTKAMVHSDQLGQGVEYDKVAAWRSYKDLVSAIASTGIFVPDMSGADQIKDFYWKEDSHWNAGGARFAAKKIAEKLSSFDDFLEIGEVKFATKKIDGAVQKKLGYLDFYNTHCDIKLPYLPADHMWQTERSEAASTANDLFSDEIMPEIVLVGTSNSTSPGPSYANFDGFLKEYLKRDVRNEAVAGGALGGSILQYFLSEDYKLHPPKFLIWEFPVHNSLNNENILREIVPAATGQCAAENKILSSHGNTQDQKVSLFPDLSSKIFSSSNNYISLKLEKESPRQIEIIFEYKDGSKDKINLNRSLRVFPDISGQYYAAFSDGLGELTNIKISAKDSVGKFDAAICHITKPTKKDIRASYRQDSILTLLSKKAKSWFAENENNYELQASEDKGIENISLPSFNKALIDIPSLKDGKIIPASDSSLKLAGRLASFPGSDNQNLPIILYTGIYDFTTFLQKAEKETVTETAESYILNYPIIIYPQAALILNNLEKPLLLSQEKGAFISSAGSLYIINSKLTGWSEAEKKPAEINLKGNNFRPFIVLWDGGSFFAERSSFENFGFNHDKAFGISLSSNTEVRSRFLNEMITAPIMERPKAVLNGNSFKNFYSGFYATSAGQLRLNDNVFINSSSDGVVIKGNGGDLHLKGNEVSASGGHGMNISVQADRAAITQNNINNNKGSGVYLGKCSKKIALAKNDIRFNGADGISIYDGSDHYLIKNKMEYNEKAGLRIRNGSGISREDYSAFNQDYGFIIYGGATKARLKDVVSIGNKGSLRTDHAGNITFKFMQSENIFGGDLKGLEKKVLKAGRENKETNIKFVNEEKR